jgi:hypothetical protein
LAWDAGRKIVRISFMGASMANKRGISQAEPFEMTGEFESLIYTRKFLSKYLSTTTEVIHLKNVHKSIVILRFWRGIAGRENREDLLHGSQYGQ